MNSANYTAKLITIKALFVIISALFSLIAIAAGAFLFYLGYRKLGSLIIIFILISAIGFVAVLLISRTTDRLMRLLRTEKWVEGLDSVQFFYSREEERLIASFVSEEAEKNLWEENRRQAQYKALQNQINPHFLYNTLEAIRSEALIGGLGSVAEMSESLAKFFRYTISNTENFVTVADEIRNVRDYMRIQQYRFGERISLKLLIPDDDESLKAEIPKLILQPLVENAIIHGVANMDDGYIKLSAAAEGGTLVLAVEDNGQGIPPEILRRLQSPEREMPAGHLGLRNVDRIVRLYYGKEYGISAVSAPGMGSRVELRLPMRKKEENYAEGSCDR